MASFFEVSLRVGFLFFFFVFLAGFTFSGECLLLVNLEAHHAAHGRMENTTVCSTGCFIFIL